jgi:uncharacterized protein involved in exopolysaccharide biosynthesis
MAGLTDARSVGLSTGSPSNGQSELPTLTTYAERLRRDASLIVTLMVVGLLLGISVVWNSSPMYTSTAAVLLEPIPTAVPLRGTVDPRAVTIDTQAQLVLSDRVVNEVVSATRLDADEVRSALRVAAFPLSEVLRISATTDDPEVSRTAAQVASETLLEQRTRLSLEARASVNDLRYQLGEIREKIKNPNRASAYALRTRLYRQTSYLRAQDLSQIDPGRIISPAVMPTRPAGSSPEVHLAGFTMGGFLLAILIGEARARRRSSDFHSS